MPTITSGVPARPYAVGSVLCAALVANSVGAQRAPYLPSSALGCFRVEVAPWTPNLRLGEDSIYTQPPRHVEIGYEITNGGIEREGHIVKPAPRTAASVHGLAFARREKGDSVAIVWTTMFSGLTMRLAIHGDTLIGHADPFWDFPRRRQTATAKLIREKC